MKTILLNLFFVGMVFSVAAQKNAPINPVVQPYCEVDKLPADLKYLLINPDKIESVDVLKGEAALRLYGDQAKDGAIIIKMKPYTKLLGVNDIFSKYNLSPADQQLRICINKVLVNNPKLIVAEESEILKVEITSGSYTIDPSNANSNERFINISTANARKLAM